jgi:hypothetical protein
MVRKRTAREPRYSVDLTDRAKEDLKELAVRWGVSGSDTVELLIRKECGRPPFDHSETLRTVAEHLGMVGMPEARPRHPIELMRDLPPNAFDDEKLFPVVPLHAQPAPRRVCRGCGTGMTPTGPDPQRDLCLICFEKETLAAGRVDLAAPGTKPKTVVTFLDEPPPPPPAPLGPIVRAPEDENAPAWTRRVLEDMLDGAVVPDDAQEALRLWRHGVDVACPPSYGTGE